ncbi:MAG TPA: calcium/sodium antiporter [Rhizomicrobium sp.]
MAYWFLAGGLLLLIAGSEAAVRGGVGLARVMNLSPVLIGLLVIASATSAPELFVALRAATAGAPDIALGDIVGGNILMLLLALGLGALVRPLASPPKVVLRDGGAMLAGALLVAFFALNGDLTRRDGLFLFLGFLAYLAGTFFSDWRRSADHSVALSRALARSRREPPPVVGSLFLLILGLICLVLGALVTVNGSVALARALNLQQAFVGLTIVAFGTSLPKLIAVLVAAVRGHTDVAVGLLIGAVVFNLLGVLGITAMVAPLAVSRMLASADIYVMVAASAALLPLLAMRWRLSRPRGALLALSYLCYVAFLVWRQGLLPLSLLGIG